MARVGGNPDMKGRIALDRTKFVSLNEVVRTLHITPNRAKRLIAAHSIPGVILPPDTENGKQQIRIPRNPWLRWLADNGFEPTEEATL